MAHRLFDGLLAGPKFCRGLPRFIIGFFAKRQMRRGFFKAGGTLRFGFRFIVRNRGAHIGFFFAQAVNLVFRILQNLAFARGVLGNRGDLALQARNHFRGPLGFRIQALLFQRQTAQTGGGTGFGLAQIGQRCLGVGLRGRRRG